MPPPRNPNDPPFPDLGHLRRLLLNPQLIDLLLALVRWFEENSHQSTDVDSGSSPAEPQPPMTPPCPSIDRQFPDLEYLQRLFKDSGLGTLRIRLGRWLENNTHRSTNATSSSPGKLLSMTPPRPTIDVKSSDLEHHRRLIVGALLKLLKWLEKNIDRSLHNPRSSLAKAQPTTTTPYPPIGAQVPDVECLQSLIVIALLIVVLLIVTLLQLERRLGNNSSQSTNSSSSSPEKSQLPMTPPSTTIDAQISDLEDRRRPLADALLRLVPWLENNGHRLTPGSSSSPAKPQPPLTPPCTPIDRKFPDLEDHWHPLVDVLLKLVQCLENNSYPSIHDSSSPTTSPKPPMTPRCNPIDQRFPELEYHWLQPVETLLKLMRYPESNKSRSGPPNTSPMSSQSWNSVKSCSTQSDACSTSPPAGSPPKDSRSRKGVLQRAFRLRRLGPIIRLSRMASSQPHGD